MKNLIGTVVTLLLAPTLLSEESPEFDSLPQEATIKVGTPLPEGLEPNAIKLFPGDTHKKARRYCRRSRDCRPGRRRPRPNQCLLGGDPADRMASVVVQAVYPEDILEVFEGESLTLKIENLGTGYFEYGAISAKFGPRVRTIESQFHPHLGWGLYDASPSSSTIRGLFTRLEAGDIAETTPKVGNTCTPFFPMDTRVEAFDFTMDVLCRINHRDGKFRFTLSAKKPGRAKRILRQFDHHVCLNQSITIPPGEDPYSNPENHIAPLPKGASYRDFPWGFVKVH